VLPFFFFFFFFFSFCKNQSQERKKRKMLAELLQRVLPGEKLAVDGTASDVHMRLDLAHGADVSSSPRIRIASRLIAVAGHLEESKAEGYFVLMSNLVFLFFFFFFSFILFSRLSGLLTPARYHSHTGQQRK
jgi:hypothetical protein